MEVTLGGQIFIYGMVTAFCISGAFEAAGYRPLIKTGLPWWIYVIGVIGAIILATRSASVKPSRLSAQKGEENGPQR